jgi:hypothetical protein
MQLHRYAVVCCNEIDRGVKKALSNAPKTANEAEGPNKVNVVRAIELEYTLALLLLLRLSLQLTTYSTLQL